MTFYCVDFWANHWCVRPELFAMRGQVVTYYLRACRIADYLNLRASRVNQSVERLVPRASCG